LTRNCPSGWLRKQHVAPFVLFFLKHHTLDKIRWFQESSFRKNGMHTCSRLMKCLSILEFGMRDEIRRPAPSGKLRNSNCEHQILPISYALEFEHRVDAFSQFLWRHAERDREREREGRGEAHFKVFKQYFLCPCWCTRMEGVHTAGCTRAQQRGGFLLFVFASEPRG
jgi:hypothetical protein